jgi:hypothetical protein
MSTRTSNARARAILTTISSEPPLPASTPWSVETATRLRVASSASVQWRLRRSFRITSPTVWRMPDTARVTASTASVAGVPGDMAPSVHMDAYARVCRRGMREFVDEACRIASASTSTAMTRASGQRPGEQSSTISERLGGLWGHRPVPAALPGTVVHEDRQKRAAGRPVGTSFVTTKAILFADRARPWRDPPSTRCRRAGPLAPLAPLGPLAQPDRHRPRPRAPAGASPPRSGAGLAERWRTFR